MSRAAFDQQPDAYQYDQPKKKSPWKWIFIGGCGCFSLILLSCCGFGFYMYSMTTTFMVEQINQAEQSERVADILGGGVSVDAESAMIEQSGPGSVEFRFNIKGDSDEAVLVFIGEIKSISKGWELKETYLEKDGKKVDLDPDKELDFGLDDLNDLELGE